MQDAAGARCDTAAAACTGGGDHTGKKQVPKFCCGDEGEPGEWAIRPACCPADSNEGNTHEIAEPARHLILMLRSLEVVALSWGGN